MEELQYFNHLSWDGLNRMIHLANLSFAEGWRFRVIGNGFTSMIDINSEAYDNWIYDCEVGCINFEEKIITLRKVSECQTAINNKNVGVSWIIVDENGKYMKWDNNFTSKLSEAIKCANRYTAEKIVEEYKRRLKKVNLEPYSLIKIVRMTSFIDDEEEWYI